MSVTSASQGAFRQGQEVVGLLPVGLRLDVLVAEPTHSDNHVDRATVLGYVEAPLATFDPLYRFLLADPLSGVVAVAAADGLDSLIGIVAVGLVDAEHFVSVGHGPVLSNVN